ncbi:MAG: response regulator [Flavobacterium sp. BFFFF2]|nr:MAG: response regulator [Flavobacterium sp. BFFFF2]
MKKIVIVDDEPNIVMTLEYAFRKAGFDVYIARDGQEALDLLVNTIPDVIMLDIMMPQLDGFATLQQIRLHEQLNTCKVVFLTAKNKATDIQKGLDLGADLYLTKPFSIKKVIEQVQELLA